MQLFSTHGKHFWHSGKLGMVLLIFLKVGQPSVQRPVKWINDKAKSKSTAMKLSSLENKQFIPLT